MKWWENPKVGMRIRTIDEYDKVGQQLILVVDSVVKDRIFTRVEICDWAPEFVGDEGWVTPSRFSDDRPNKWTVDESNLVANILSHYEID